MEDKLSPCEPVVYHLGNSLSPRWEEEAKRLELQLSNTERTRPGGLLSFVIHRPRVQRAMLRIQDTLFDLTIRRDAG